MAEHRSSASLFRFCAALVLLLAVSADSLQVFSLLEQTTKPDASGLFAAAVPPLITLMAGIGLAALLEGIAQMMEKQSVSQPDIGAAIDHLSVSMEHIRETLQSIAPVKATPAQAAWPAPTEIPLAPPLQAMSPVAATHLEPYLARMVELLEELKEVSLLDETERFTRRSDAVVDERANGLDTAAQCIEARDWPGAEAILQKLEMRYGDDADVAVRRSELTTARLKAESDAFSEVSARVEQSITAHDFDHAISIVEQFRGQHPQHEAAMTLARQLVTDKAAYRERTVNRLFDDIRGNVEQKKWRHALDGVQRLLGQFPDHPKSDRIRQQLRPIQNNAEVEERQEQELRIQELIRSKRFGEAAELGQALLQRFPNAPQIAAMRELLPKLRDLATQQLSDSDAVTS